MTVRRVDDDDVDLVLRPGSRRAPRRPGAMAAPTRRRYWASRLYSGLDVLDQRPHVGEAVEADQLAVFHQRQLADLVLLHDVVGLLQGRARGAVMTCVVMTSAIGASGSRANLMSAAVRMPTRRSLSSRIGNPLKLYPLACRASRTVFSVSRDAERDRVRRSGR